MKLLKFTNKYYLVDTGYPNRKCYLAPYHTTRYHVTQFQASQPRGKEEHFNQMHSSLMNVIERSFGVLKKCWNILNFMPPYSYKKQVKIVIACVALHNFIIEWVVDEILEESVVDEDIAPEEDIDNDNVEPTILDKIGMGNYRNAIRDLITNARELV